MKNIFVTLVLLAAVTVRAQTNSVKGSAEPSASSLTGAESVLVIQGGTTKLSNVAAIQAAPLNAVAATNTALVASMAAVAASVTTASNALQTQITANGAANTSTNNALQTLIAANTARDTATTNGLQTQISANATTAAAANLATSNAIIGIANAAAAQSVATGVTNGGAANFGYVSYAVAHLGTITNSGSIVVSASLATVQNLYVQASGSGNKTLNLSLTNLSAGQSFSVVINRTDFYGPATYNVVLPSGAINLNSGGATTVALAPQKSLLLNFNTIGATVSQTIMSASVSQ